MQAQYIAFVGRQNLPSISACQRKRPTLCRKRQMSTLQRVHHAGCGCYVSSRLPCAAAASTLLTSCSSPRVSCTEQRSPAESKGCTTCYYHQWTPHVYWSMYPCLLMDNEQGAGTHHDAHVRAPVIVVELRLPLPHTNKVLKLLFVLHVWRVLEGGCLPHHIVSYIVVWKRLCCIAALMLKATSEIVTVQSKKWPKVSS